MELEQLGNSPGQLTVFFQNLKRHSRIPVFPQVTVFPWKILRRGLAISFLVDGMTHTCQTLPHQDRIWFSLWAGTILTSPMEQYLSFPFLQGPCRSKRFHPVSSVPDGAGNMKLSVV